MIDKLVDSFADRVALEGEKIRDEFRAGLAQTHAGLRVTAARYLPFPGNSALANGGPGRLVGWSALAAGGPVTVTFHDGRDANGDVFSILDMVAGESDRTWFGTTGISFGEALYLEVTGTGTLTGAVYLGAVD